MLGADIEFELKRNNRFVSAYDALSNCRVIDGCWDGCESCSECEDRNTDWDCNRPEDVECGGRNCDGCEWGEETACSNSGNSGNGDIYSEIGCDGRRETGELRPPPGNSWQEISRNTKNLVRRLIDSIGDRYDIYSGPFFDYAIGGHIHFSEVNRYKYDILPRLDYYLAMPLEELMIPSLNIKRKKSYGAYSSSEPKDWGWEYRTLPSFIINEDLVDFVYCVTEKIVKTVISNESFPYGSSFDSDSLEDIHKFWGKYVFDECKYAKYLYGLLRSGRTLPNVDASINNNWVHKKTSSFIFSKEVIPVDLIRLNANCDKVYVYGLSGSKGKDLIYTSGVEFSPEFLQEIAYRRYTIVKGISGSAAPYRRSIGFSKNMRINSYGEVLDGSFITDILNSIITTNEVPKRLTNV